MWKKTAGRMALAALALLGLLTLATFLFVRTDTFHRLVLQKITLATADATGGRLEVGSFAIHWSALSVDFYGVKLHGTETPAQPPLFAADHLNVGLKIVSILRRKINLSRVMLDRPAFYLRVDAQGRSNLPVSSNSGKTSSSGATAAKLFDMAVQSVIVSSGVISYNDRQAQLSADLQGFHLRVGFDNISQGYRAAMGYDRGLLAFKNFEPIGHHAEIQLTATRSGIVVDQLMLQTAQSRLAANGNLVNYLTPVLQASYQASLHTNELAAILHVPALPPGAVTMSGTARYRSGSDRSFVDTMYVDGTLASPVLLLRIGRGVTQAKSVHATYRLQDGNLYVENATSELLGGSGAGKFEMAHLTGTSTSKFEGSLNNSSLDEISRVLLPAAGGVRLAGRANITAQGSWTADIRNVSGHISAAVTGPLPPAGERSASPGRQTSAARAVNLQVNIPVIIPVIIPVNGNIDVSYDGARSTAVFEHSSIRTASADLSFSGPLGNRSALNVAAHSSDLRELAKLIAAIDTGIQASGGKVAPGSSPSALQNLDIAGSANFSGQVLGPLKNPRITGQLAADNFEVAGSSWRTLQTNVEASPTVISLSGATLAGAQQGTVNLTLRANLADWSFTPTSMIVGQLTASHMSIADLERIARVHYPVTGDLSANISFDGSERNPAGHGSLTITNASAWNEPIASLAVQFQGDGNSIRSSEQLRTGGGNLSANIGFSPQTGEYDAAVNIPGLALGKLRTVEARTEGISGTLSGTADGRGTLQNPHVNANLQIAQLQFHDQTIRLVQVRLNMGEQHATFTLQSDLEQGTLQAKGDADLTGEHMASASIEIHALPISLLLANYLPRGGPRFGGQTEIHAALRGPLSEPARLEAHVDIPTLTVGYKSAEVSSVRPIQIDYRNGIVTLQPTEMRGNGTELNLRGNVPIKSAESMDVSAKGTLDLSSLNGLTPDLETSGQVELDIAARGALAHPITQGQVQVLNGSLSSASIPVGFERMNLQVALQGNRAEISRLSATAGGGTVSGTGFMVYGPQTNFSVNIDAKGVRVRYPEGVRTVADANLQMEGSPANSALSGRVLINRLSFTQNFDIATFMGQFSGGPSAESPSPFQQNMKLNVAVQSAQDLNAESNQLSIEGSANVHLGGTLANPIILGRTTLTGGDIFFLGKRYVVQNGTIEFANPIRTQPIVNVFMSTTVQQYNITLNFIGPLDRLRTNYNSSPALPPSDIINLIAFGKTAEQAATGPSTPPTLGAESVLAKSVSGQVSGQIERLAGISQLTIDPLASSDPTAPGSQIAIQQRITGSLLFTFSTNVTSTQNQAVQLHYQANRNLSVSVLRDRNGGYAVDVRIRKTF
jgi:translocation and assembly module TamB